MPHTNVTKLFAVVALATAQPAAAGPGHAHAKPAPVEVTPAATPPLATASAHAIAAFADAVLAIFGVAIPRTLPSGAPACGNLGGKVSPRERARCAERP